MINLVMNTMGGAVVRLTLIDEAYQYWANWLIAALFGYVWGLWAMNIEVYWLLLVWPLLAWSLVLNLRWRQGYRLIPATTGTALVPGGVTPPVPGKNLKPWISRAVLVTIVTLVAMAVLRFVPDGSGKYFIVVPFFATSWIVFVQGIRPLALAIVAAIGASLNTVRIKNPVTGATDAVQSWMINVVTLVIYMSQLLAGGLILVGFGGFPIGFWAIAAMLMLIVSANVFHEKASGGWLYASAMMIAILVIIKILFIVSAIGVMNWWNGPEDRTTRTSTPTVSRPAPQTSTGALMFGGSSTYSPPPTTTQTGQHARAVNGCPAGQFADARARGVLFGCTQLSLFKNGAPFRQETNRAEFCTFFTNGANVHLDEEIGPDGNLTAYLVTSAGNASMVSTIAYQLRAGQSFRGNEC